MNPADPSPLPAGTGAGADLVEVRDAESDEEAGERGSLVPEFDERGVDLRHAGLAGDDESLELEHQGELVTGSERSARLLDEHELVGS